MSGLSYVGADPTDPRDIETRVVTEEILTDGVSRSYVDGRVDALMNLRASKTYVDTQDELYVENAYYTSQDALLVPLTAKGVANGVATLDGSSKLPLAQTPVLGGGILKGPWGYDSAFSGTTNDVPLKIAQWNVGVTSVTGFPMALFQASVLAVGCRPVIEVRIGTTTQTAYVDQTLIAQGFGRFAYEDYQFVSVLPATSVLSETQDGVQDSLSASGNYLVNAWVFADVPAGQITVNAGAVVTGSFFMARTTL